PVAPGGQSHVVCGVRPGTDRDEEGPGPCVLVRGVLGALAAGAAAPAQSVSGVLRRARPVPAVQVPPVPAGRALHPQRGHYPRRPASCQKESANRAKAAAKVARAHRKVRNARRDFRHRASTSLVRSADLIVIEDLAVSNMVRNRRLARAISDCGWGEFRRQLEYKCERYGRHLVIIDRWYPSSKT